MKRRTELGVTAVLALLCANASVAEEPDVCALLASAEVDSAVGVKVGPSSRHDDKMPAGPLKDQPRLGCGWSIGAGETDLTRTGSVYLSLIPVVSTDQAGAAVASRRALSPPATTGWKTKEVTVGDAICLITTTDVKFAGTMTGCSIDTKGWVVSIDARGHPLKTKPEKLNGLLDTAASRLP